MKLSDNEVDAKRRQREIDDLTDELFKCLVTPNMAQAMPSMRSLVVERKKDPFVKVLLAYVAQLLASKCPRPQSLIHRLGQRANAVHAYLTYEVLSRLQLIQDLLPADEFAGAVHSVLQGLNSLPRGKGPLWPWEFQLLSVAELSQTMRGLNVPEITPTQKMSSSTRANSLALGYGPTFDTNLLCLLERTLLAQRMMGAAYPSP
ncbi:hypothetical protein DUNSADRAFT_13922 [Dunaliella salina]|uniref:Uncharacterized protein n=1 Tax=Dunaliella salina TaxID=3046 RepID=A0ABQ7G8G4_DUNSA|nr:hypothetical protein DUNSADRAFT_13922 [Dunaliella salina]|eukprot:KAF5830887.1 hypothetical protein DUNSADRAFT_13922 [Dunaliella salina]